MRIQVRRGTPSIQDRQDGRAGSAKMMDVALGGCVICLMVTVLGVLLFIRAEFLPGATRAKTTKAAPAAAPGKSRREFPDVEDTKTHTGTITRTGPLGRHAGAVHDLAVKPGGVIAVSGGEDKQVRIWDLKTGKPINTLSGHEHPVLTVAISSTGDEIASGDSGGVIRVWERESGKLLQEIKDRHAGAVRCVEFYPLGHVVVSGGSDRTVRLTEIHTRRELHKFSAEHPAAVTAAILSHTGRHVFVGCEDGSVMAWSFMSETAPSLRFDGLQGAILALSLSHDGNTLSAVSATGQRRHWDVQGGGGPKEVSYVELPRQGRVSAAAISFGGLRIVHADDKDFLKNYDAEQRRNDSTEHAMNGRITALAYAHRGMNVVCGTDAGDLSIWELPPAAFGELSGAGKLAQEIETRGLAHVEYGEHLEKAVDAIDDQDLELAKKEFKISRDLAVSGTIEHDVADMGVEECSKTDEKKERYTALMEEGRELMMEGNFTGARKKFETAQTVHPEGEEAKKGIKRCDQATKTELILRTADFPQQEIEFDYRPDGQDPLLNDTEFVWLYSQEKLDEFRKNARSPIFRFSRPTAQEPPMGLGNSPLVWIARMETNAAIQVDNLKIRIRLIRASKNETIAEHDIPLEKGNRVYQINGTADAPEYGWTTGDYYFRKFLVAELNDEEAADFGRKEIEFEDNRPNSFRMGMMHWHKEERSLSPQDVQQTPRYTVHTRLAMAPGDAFRLDAEGHITPARPGFYREFFIGENVRMQPVAPEGVGYPRQTMDFWKLRANGLPWAALIYMFESENAMESSPMGKLPEQMGLPPQTGVPQPSGLPGQPPLPPGTRLPNGGRVSPAHRLPPQGLDPFQTEFKTNWHVYKPGNTCVLVDRGGSLRVSINSVLAKRKTLRQEFQQIAPNDDQYWRKDSPSFEIILWRGEFDFNDALEPELKMQLLKPFRR